MKDCWGAPKGLEGVLIAALGVGEADLKASKGDVVDEGSDGVVWPKALVVGDSTGGWCCCANDVNT